MASETRTLRNVALAHGIDVGIRETPLDPTGWNEYSNVEIDFDVDVQARRTFVKQPQVELQSNASAQPASGLATSNPTTSQEDKLTYATVDFVLA